MREILFRGKRTDNGEWVSGRNLLLLDDTKMYIAQTGETAYTFLNNANNVVKLEANLYSVILETVGQFTGLNDKNGKKIFEHDIVRCEFNSAPPMNGKVVFENGAFGLRWKHHGSGVENFAAFECICNVEYTVIGNIQDNPELTEV